MRKKKKKKATTQQAKDVPRVAVYHTIRDPVPLPPTCSVRSKRTVVMGRKRRLARVRAEYSGAEVFTLPTPDYMVYCTSCEVPGKEQYDGSSPNQDTLYYNCILSDGTGTVHPCNQDSSRTLPSRLRASQCPSNAKVEPLSEGHLSPCVR